MVYGCVGLTTLYVAPNIVSGFDAGRELLLPRIQSLFQSWMFHQQDILDADSFWLKYVHLE